MKILWLCSWYPHATDPFDGDFVERHAKALAIYTDVEVIHVVQNFQFLQAGKGPREEKRTEGRLTSSIYFLPLPDTGIGFLQKIIFNRRYQRFYQHLLDDYIRVNGKPDLIHVHVPVKAGGVGIKLKNSLNIPLVVTEHSSAYFEHIPGNYFQRNRYFQFVTKNSFEQAQVVSSVSQWLLNRLQELFKIQQTNVIRNVVDTTLFCYHPSVNHTKRFIHVSLMHPLKNVNGILRALAILNRSTTNWEMNFIGPASTDNIQLAAELGLTKQIAWKGTLSYAEVATEMKAADALVHFSKYENLPCVVNEALCCGLPVFSSNVGGISELINPTNGVLVEEGDSQALASALYSYLQNPTAFNRKAISETAMAQFQYNRIGKEILELYNMILKKN
jgi:glycosyltransferase involved in cell wall biosynthesis